MNSMQFACSKIKMKQGKLITKNDINRLLDANSFNDAKQVLVDIAFMPSVDDNYELYADKMLDKACQNIMRYCHDEKLKKILLIKYDAHNIKMLFKARILGIEANDLYSVGIYRLEDLKRSVINHNYKMLENELREAMDKLELVIISDFDPYLIDVIIDKACYKCIFRLLSESKYPILHEYFIKKVYFLNTITLLRLKNMGKSIDALKDVLIEAKGVDKDSFIKGYNSPQYLYNVLLNISKPFAKEYIRYINHQSQLQNLEKIVDNILLDCFRDIEYKLIDVNNFILYILKLQRSLLAVRLIMSVKARGLENNEILERMRNLDAR